MPWPLVVLIIAAAVVLTPIVYKYAFVLYLAAIFNGWLPAPTPPLDIDKARHEAIFPDCILPIVPATNRMVVAEVYEGDTLADVTIGAEDHTHTVVTVHVGWGFTPITAVLIGTGVIWDFEGSVDRVERVYAVSSFGMAPAGVRGLPAEKALFPMLSAHCSHRYSDREDPRRQENILTIMFGRKPDAISYRYEAMSLDLSSGGFSERGGVADGGTDYYPGGVRDLMPASIGSSAPVRDRSQSLVERVLNGKPIPVKRKLLIIPPWPRK